MFRMFAFLALIVLATGASAQSRDRWIRKCQGEDAELSTSNGYRACTELYVIELEKQQNALLSKLGARLASGETEPNTAVALEHLRKSQDLWRSYVAEHCQVAQAVLGGESPVGDAVPSCRADLFESHNAQLRRLLAATNER